MVDPVSLIVAALVAGAAASTKEVTGTAIKDAYTGLKELVKRKFAGNAKAEEALADHEEDPETYEKPLKKALTQTGADQDQAILQEARRVIELAGAQQGSASKFTTHFHGSVRNVAMGDHMQVDMSEKHGSGGASEKDK